MVKSADKRLVAERERTDASLKDERLRLDEVLAGRQHAANDQVDASIRESRATADGIIAENRAQLAPPDADMRKQRATSDHRNDLARFEVDAAIKHERHQESLVKASLLHQERAWTDARLRIERERTDLHFEEDAGVVDGASATSPRDAKNAFLAMVSHDLKSPLSGIMMGLDLLASIAVQGDGGERVLPLANMMRRAVTGMLFMVNDLLDVERISLGRFPMNASLHDLSEVIRQGVADLQLVAEETGVSVSCKLPGVPALAEFDRLRLTQVLSNLLGNALKFTPRGGSIRIDLAACEDGWRLSVSDTGPGIPESQLEEVFARYAQLKANDRRGLGLGLYICRTIIDAHHGRIWAESPAGQGSSFSLILPRLFRASS